MSVLSALLPYSARRVIEAQFGQSGSFEFTKSKAREILEPLESLEEGIVKAVRNKLAEFPFSPPHNVSLDARPFQTVVGRCTGAQDRWFSELRWHKQVTGVRQNRVLLN
jgi:hypothetical protein